MRAKLVTAIAGLLLLIALGHPLRADEPTAVGLWQAVDDETHQPTGWFIIRDSDGTYVGSIAKMYLKPGEDPAVICTQCTGDRHDKPWLGLEIIRGMKRDGLKYEDGNILDPRDGKVYHALMTLSPDGQTLVVRGYFGISLLGRNQYWKRLPDSDYSELDPSLNPNHAVATPPRKTGTSLKKQNAIGH